MSVRSEKQGPVTTVILSRPGRRNAVDAETARQLAAAFRAFEADTEAKAGVFHGDHGAFRAGDALKRFTAGAGAPVLQAEGDGAMGPTGMLPTEPVIAAVAGHDLKSLAAGGMELARWCDLRVLEEDAVMGVVCRRWGVPLSDGGTCGCRASLAWAMPSSSSSAAARWARRSRRWPASSRASRSRASRPQVCRPTGSGIWRSRRRSSPRPGAAWRRPPARRSRPPHASPRASDATAPSTRSSAIPGRLKSRSGRAGGDPRGPPVARRARAGAGPRGRCRERQDAGAVPTNAEPLQRRRSRPVLRGIG